MSTHIITVCASDDSDDDALDALFERVADAAHELDEQVTCTMTSTDAAVAALDAVDGSDPEGAHGAADDVLLGLVDEHVAAAYDRLVARCTWWAYA